MTEQNKYALVTGSADRIGKAIAMHLAKMGYNLMLHFRSSLNKAELLKQNVESLGVKAELVQFDFLEDNNFDQLFYDLKTRGIVLDILVNNASDFTQSGFQDIGHEMLAMQIKSNFEGAYLLTKAFARVFSKGSVINLLDTKINKDRTKHLDYILSKKLLGEFTKIAALHLAPTMRVNAICPGLILPPYDEDEQYLLNLASGIPLQKIGNLLDIQKTVQFLVESNFVTGQIIYVDGGEHLSY